MEVIEQLGIGTANRNTTELTRKRAMVNVRRAPEIATCGQVAKLHHPGRTPQMVTFLRAIMV